VKQGRLLRSQLIFKSGTEQTPKEFRMSDVRQVSSRADVLSRRDSARNNKLGLENLNDVATLVYRPAEKNYRATPRISVHRGRPEARGPRLKWRAFDPQRTFRRFRAGDLIGYDGAGVRKAQ
jgi:hypothetical protein